MTGPPLELRGHRRRWLPVAGAILLALTAGIGIGVGVGVGMGAKRPAAAASPDQLFHAGAAAAAPAAAATVSSAISAAVARRTLAARAQKKPPSIVMVGDGLTESSFSFKLAGWGSQVVGAYIRKADVINRGFGGYFSGWFKDYMLGSLFDVSSPRMGIIFLGVKDSQLPAVAGKAYTSPQAFKANVDAIIGAGRIAGVRHWLLITPPPVYEVRGKTGTRSNANTKLYVDELKSLARKHNAALLDIFTTWAAVPGWADKYLKDDKLHLNEEGNAKLFTDVMETIKAKLPAMDPAVMPWQFPPMDDINKENPAAAFRGLA